MSYSSSIPVITDALGQSYGQVRANFEAINTAFADNHGGLTQDLTIAGMHKVLTMRPESGDPTTSAIQTALYNKLVSSIPALFFRPNSNQTAIQLTNGSIQTGLQSTNPDVYYPQQYTFMAGPFIVYGGYLANVANNHVVTLTPGSGLLYVDLTVVNQFGIIGQPAMAVPTSISGTSFTVKIKTIGGNRDIYYFAIGAP